MPWWTDEKRWRVMFYLACALFLIGVMTVTYRPWLWDYCGAESPGPCARDWLFMISGWGTVFGGALAAYLVYQTIMPLKHQLDEVRRQTRFMVGDENPILELLKNAEGAQSGRFRVVNWNRNAFVICEIAWFADTRFAASDHIDFAGNVTIGVQNGVLERRQDIPGWEDRNASPPPSIIGEYAIIGNFGRLPDDLKNAKATLTITGYVSARDRRKVTISATAPVAELYL